MTKIYLQTHKVDLWGLPSSEGEGGIFTSKSWIEKQENWGLVFLVTTGTYNQYREAGFNRNLPETMPSSQKIYFLWEKFEVEQVQQCSDGQFFATGSKLYNLFTPPLLLNDTPGFDKFRHHYMTCGLINLAKKHPPYLQTLLQFSDEA